MKPRPQVLVEKGNHHHLTHTHARTTGKTRVGALSEREEEVKNGQVERKGKRRQNWKGHGSRGGEDNELR